MNPILLFILMTAGGIYFRDRHNKSLDRLIGNEIFLTMSSALFVGASIMVLIYTVDIIL